VSAVLSLPGGVARDLACMLIPEPYDPSWTALNDGVFNDYPPPPPPPPAAAPSGSVAAQIAGAITQSMPPVAVPNGTALWKNPTVATGIPLSPANSGLVLPANIKRNLLIIQNTSVAAAGAGNTAPTLYVNFGAAATAASALAFTAGQGIVLDYIVPRNEIYVLFAGGSGTFTASGVIQQGSHTLDDLRVLPTVGGGSLQLGYNIGQSL